MLENTRNRRPIPVAERRRWLERNEGGTTLSALALETGRNIRTIKSHVQRAIDEREHALARTSLYRDALTNHNADLLKALHTMRENLKIPPDEQATVRPRFRDSLGAYFYGGFFQFRTHEVIEAIDGPALDSAMDDPQRLLDLAREHLGRDKKLWSGIDRWRRAQEEYVAELSILGDQVAAKAAKELGMSLVSLEGGAKRVEEGIHEDFISSVCHLGIKMAREDATESAEEPQIVDGQLRYRGSAIVTSPSPSKLQAAQALFGNLSEVVARNERVFKIVGLRDQLVRRAPVLQRMIGDIILGGIVTGRCSVCQRLGS